MKPLSKLFSFGPLLIVIAAFLWAVDGVLRRQLFSLPPITIVFFEHFVGSLFVLPFLFGNWRQVVRLHRKEILTICAISLFSSLLGTLWFTTALLKVNFISFSVVFLLQKLQPIFVISAAALILKERITRQYLVWAGLAVIAAYFVTFRNGVVNFQTGSGTIEAALYAVGAAFVWGTSTIFSKIALRTKSDTLITGLRFVLTTVLAFLAVILMNQLPSLATVTLPQLRTFILIALSTGMLALAIYYRGLANTEAKVATILELVFPVTAVIIDAVVYKSFLAPSQYFAAGILLFAAVQISRLSSERIRFVSYKVKGKGRGKPMGVPTINLQIPKDLKLRDGIYAAYVTMNTKTYKGALHFGPIPTFGEEKKSLEVFLLDVAKISEKEVASAKIAVDVISYLRPIYSFSSVEDLVAQIEIDVNRTRRILL